MSRIVAAIGTGVTRAAEEHKRSNSSLQIGLLDPIALTVRSMTTSVLPTVHKATESVYTEPREYWQAWIVGLSLHWLPGSQLVDSPVFLPGCLSSGGFTGNIQPVRSLAHRPRPGSVH